MIERPILFSAPMVRAILEGRKTQTRRVYKPLRPAPYEHIEDGSVWEMDECGEYAMRQCPLGTIGDRLWVREAFYECVNNNDCIRYAADGPAPTSDTRIYRKRPSIHMLRRDSRLTIEITGIRVERLRDISEEDARAEGVGVHGGWNADETECGVNARGPFSRLWDSINAKSHPWAANPWVWVIEFRRAEMIDIDKWEARMTRRDDEPLLPPSPEEVLDLIAEIRRLRGEAKPNGHRRCKCGDIPLVGVWTYSSGKSDYLAFCPKCSARVGCPVGTESAAWAAWDGVA